MRDCAPGPLFMGCCVIASQNGGSTSYIFPFRLGFYNGVATYLIIGKIRKP